MISSWVQRSSQTFALSVVQLTTDALSCKCSKRLRTASAKSQSGQTAIRDVERSDLGTTCRNRSAIIPGAVSYVTAPRARRRHPDPIEAGGTDARLSHRYWNGTWSDGCVGSAGAVRRLMGSAAHLSLMRYSSGTGINPCRLIWIIFHTDEVYL
jgi:hypothetical protein